MGPDRRVAKIDQRRYHIGRCAMLSRIDNCFFFVVFVQGQHKADLILQIETEPLGRFFCQPLKQM